MRCHKAQTKNSKNKMHILYMIKFLPRTFQEQRCVWTTKGAARGRCHVQQWLCRIVGDGMDHDEPESWKRRITWSYCIIWWWLHWYLIDIMRIVSWTSRFESVYPTNCGPNSLQEFNFICALNKCPSNHELWESIWTQLEHTWTHGMDRFLFPS